MIIEVSSGSGRDGDKGKPGYLTMVGGRKIVTAAFPRW